MTKIRNSKPEFRTFEHLKFPPKADQPLAEDIVSNFGFRASNFKKSSERGMSLIEVIISMFMLAVLLTLYAGAMNTVAQTKKLKYENLAYHTASKKMEELRATPLISLPASGTISDPMLSQIPSGSGNFSATDYAPYSGMKEVTVTVFWNDGKAKQLVLKTLAGSGGINP